MEISADPDQLTSEEASWAGSALFFKYIRSIHILQDNITKKYDHAMKIPKTAKCSDDNGKLGLGTWGLLRQKCGQD